MGENQRILDSFSVFFSSGFEMLVMFLVVLEHSTRRSSVVQ